MSSSLEPREAEFAKLASDAQGCQACPEMRGCTRVLTDANGHPNSRIMFVGEAPGRLGAEKTAVPFHGDVAGENFDKLLRLAGLSRREAFVTNAVLCNPTDGAGNNRPPSQLNLRNCATFLRRQIEVVDPKIVVTLGAKALQALSIIEEHQLTISASVRTKNIWFGRTLIPLYHPGARALIHRNFALQTADYYFVGESVRRLDAKGGTNNLARTPKKSGWNVVRHLLSRLGSASLFKLHKIIYLIEYRYRSKIGHPLTDFFFIRQKDGPYCVELATKWHQDFDDVELTFSMGQPVLNWKGSDLFRESIEIDPSVRSFIDELLEPLAGLSEAQLKTSAYLTRPMKMALRAEREGHSGLNRALL
jgi:uracil-DNA glycosylase family 4